MAELGQSILAFIVTVLICGILSSFVPSNSKKWIQLLCGLILTTALVKPFSGIQYMDFNLERTGILQEAEQFSADGNKISKNAMADIITQNCQAYIMDKAIELGVTLTAQVTVNEDSIPVPVFVLLQGTASPYVRLQMESMIQKDLGIAKENIRWIQ